MADTSHTKLRVDLPNHWATGGESLWASAEGGDKYRLENVPFYAYGLNFGDLVEARAASPDQKPTILRVLKASGHKTLRVIFQQHVAETERLDHLYALGPLRVTFERCNETYFALDLEPRADVSAVRSQLDQLEAAGVLEYETCEARTPGSFDALPAETSGSDAPAS